MAIEAGSGAAKVPQPVGRNTCVTTIVCWPMGEAPAELPKSHDL